MAIQRVGWRSYSPVTSPVVSASTLLTSLYSAWDGEASGAPLDTSIYGVWNAGTPITVTTLNTSLIGAWNGDSAVTTLNTSLIGAWNGNGNTNDSIGTKHGTAVGALTYATGKVGQGFSMDSTGGKYLTLPNNSLSQTGDFSISVWVNISGISTWQNWIYVLDNFAYESGSNNPYGYRLYINGNAYGFNIYNKTNTPVSLYYNSASDGLGAQIAPPAGGTIKHIVITRKAGVGTKMYVNRYLKISDTSSIDPVYFSNITPKVGAGGNTNTVIDGLTVWNKELSIDEITALYNSANGVEAPFTNSILVASSKDGVGLNHGAPQGGLTYTTGKVGNAFLFNGSNAYIELPVNTLNVSQTDLTINFWGSFSSDLNPRMILSNLQYNSATTIAWGWQIVYMGSQIYIQIANGTNTSLTSYAISMPVNQFTMFTFIVDSGTVKIYKNGILGNSWTKTQTNFAYTTSHTPTIGARKTASGSGTIQYYLTNTDMVDSLTYWSKPITEDEVTALYNLTYGMEIPFSSSITAYKNTLNDLVGTTNGTAYGTLSYTSAGKIGASYIFNGSSYIDLGNSSLNFGTGSFSLSVWFNPTAGNVLQMLISKAFWSGTTPGFYLAMENRYNSNQNAITFGISTGSYYSVNTTISGVSYTVGTWNHAVVTWDSSAKSLKIYLNGAQATISRTSGVDLTNISASISNTGYTGLIGAYLDTNGSNKTLYYNGKMDSVATWTKVLSSTDVIQLYNNGTGGEYPFTSNLMASPNNKLGTDNGTLMNGTTIVPGKVGNAFSFDGVNDYVSFPDNSLSLTGDFSISLWVYFNSLSQPNSPWNQQFIFSNSVGSGGNNYGFYLYKHADNRLFFIISNGTPFSNNAQLIVPQLMVQGAWCHIVITRKYGTTTKVYLNGVEQTNAFYSAGNSSINPLYLTNQVVNLSGYGNAGGDMLNGKIDAFNVWTKELTQTEVTELYNSGTGKQLDIIPIVTNGLALNLDASRKSSYPNTGTTWYDISGGANNGTMMNSIGLTSSNGGGLTFNGTNQYINFGQNKFKVDNFTMEIVLKINELPSTPGACNSPQYGIIGQQDWGYTLRMFPDGKATFQVFDTSSNSVTIKTQNSIIGNIAHITVKKNGTSVSIYLNGVLQNTSTLSVSTIRWFYATWPFYMGSGQCGLGDYYMKGTIYLARFYTTVLTDNEITQNFNATKSRFGL